MRRGRPVVASDFVRLWSRLRADVARPEAPITSDERVLLLVAPFVIVVLAQATDPGSAGEVLLVAMRHGPEVHVTGEGPILAYVGAHLVAAGRPALDLRIDRPSLEDRFVALTEEVE
jgi:hypothetical protein